MKYAIRGLFFLAIVFTAVGFFGARSNPSPSWRPVFENDSSGKIRFGDKKALLKAVRQGCPIRVAWGEKLTDGTMDIEYAAPDFTSLVNDSDLVVQFPASMIQTDYMNAHKALLKTDPPVAWRALMSTDGHYHQFHQDAQTGQIRRIMFLRAFMLWYAFTDGTGNEPAPDMAIPNGIVLDSIIRK